MAVCECGKRMSKYARECNACYTEKHNKIVNQNRAIVATGQCPDCGAPLKRNLALSGWWQCSQYGAENFRSDNSKPSCNFQCFTE